MITCLKCVGKTRVLETRAIQGNGIRRRRVCLSCQHRFNTFERAKESQEAPDSVVAKPAKQRGRKPKVFSGLGQKDHDIRLLEWQERPCPICDNCNAAITDTATMVTTYKHGSTYIFCNKLHMDEYFEACNDD